MRKSSTMTNGYRVHAVSGTNTISFGIEFKDALTIKGLHGFAMERKGPDGKWYFKDGFKLFRYMEHEPNVSRVSTKDHPVQSFVWDDFTCKPETTYTYRFHPVKGDPQNLERLQPVEVTISTEALFSKDATHQIFFNRGVASSQAYALKFNNQSPEQLEGKEKKEALEWLSRSLDEALLGFVDNAKKGDTILGCFYEFRYLPIADALKNALDRGVDVKLIVDGKVNESTDKNGKFTASFPREDNIRTLKDAGIPKANYKLREANKNNIQHNKFMVLLKGEKQKPTEVFTGSTNISNGGIHGQTNVGHWVRDEEVATNFYTYWNILHKDPGAKANDDRSTALKKNKAFKNEVMAIQEDLDPDDLNAIPNGTTTIFSPRAGITMLTVYNRLVDTSKVSAGITLAFGINKDLKSALVDNDENGPVIFMLLEKKDKANARAKDPFVPLTWKHNVYQAYGSYLKDPLYAWTKVETNPQNMKLNFHVSYVHSKFLLHDPLSDTPIIVTGSANFSDPSTRSNDENMLVIKGDKRVADIYFTEFNRLYNHYYFRGVANDLKDKKKTDNTNDGYLDENQDWQKAYLNKQYKWKRLKMFIDMKT